ncbi:MAG: ATP-binding protein, partial [Polyangia bacterium]|nr:ATP-binding protein [Polyangia bacterium]
ERFKRRLQAQVIGKDVRVSAFSSREAPGVIQTDLLLFDRVVDNLLTNAARYTESGSVLVELEGSSSSLVLKVCDTGPGLSVDELRHVFKPGQTGRLRTEDSHGLGLSIVVTLLDQIGGRLEVLSRPGMGTTFWAHFPITPKPPAPKSSRQPRETAEEVIGRVVTFRAAGE